MEKTRFSRFFNLSELMSIVKMSADIKTADILDLDVPWRPADLEQSMERIVRRSNENKKVKVMSARVAS